MMKNYSKEKTRNRQPLAIYIHIPFCVKKCNYCDFLSGPADALSKENYMKALINEIHSYQELANTYLVKSVFIGGGTPSSIDAEWIKCIIEALKEVFTLQCEENGGTEITIEINPGTVIGEKLLTYYNVGINRISFGLQSTNNDELKMLGRIHTFEQFQENYNLARKIGFQNINIDLMSALPGQTKESYETTLRQVLALNPEHISAYSLIIEEGTLFYELYGEDHEKNEAPNLPSEEDERFMYERTREVLHESGYERYEISNYAKEGYECKHNCTYWRCGDYLGIGSGAASLIQGKRFSNERNLMTYIEKASQCYDTIGAVRYHEELQAEIEVLDQTSKMEEFMFLGLRMMSGVSTKEFEEQFKVSVDEIYGETIKTLIAEGLLKRNEYRIALTQHGIDISNYVMSEFLLS